MPTPVTPATDAIAVKPRRSSNSPSYRPSPTHSSSAAAPISAVRRHPPTSPENAGPSETNGRSPTPGTARTSAAATTVIDATGIQDSTAKPDVGFPTVVPPPAMSQRMRAARFPFDTDIPPRL